MWCSERRVALRLIAALPAAGLAAACGFQPLYGSGTPAMAMLGRVDVAPLSGEAGFVLRQRIVERVGAPDAATHRLDVELDIEQVGVVLTSEDDVTRYNIIGNAAFALRPIGAGEQVLIGDVRAITGYSAPTTRIATTFSSRVARQDAERRVAVELADRIVQRLALTSAEWAV